MPAATSRRGQEVTLHGVLDVDHADVRVHERAEAAVEVGDDDLAVPRGPTGALDRRGVDRDELHSQTLRRLECGLLPQVLGPVVDREV